MMYPPPHRPPSLQCQGLKAPAAARTTRQGEPAARGGGRQSAVPVSRALPATSHPYYVPGAKPCMPLVCERRDRAPQPLHSYHARAPLLMPAPAGRRTQAVRAVAAPEQSVYDAIKQNSEFPPETAVSQAGGGWQPPGLTAGAGSNVSPAMCRADAWPRACPCFWTPGPSRPRPSCVPPHPADALGLPAAQGLQAAPLRAAPRRLHAHPQAARLHHARWVCVGGLSGGHRARAATCATPVHRREHPASARRLCLTRPPFPTTPRRAQASLSSTLPAGWASPPAATCGARAPSPRRSSMRASPRPSPSSSPSR